MGRREWRSSKSSLAAGFGEQETVPPTGQKVRTDVSHDMGSSIHTHVNSHTSYKYPHVHTQRRGGKENQRKIKFLCSTYVCLFIQYGTPALGIVPSYAGWDSSPPLIPHRHIPNLSPRWSKPCQVDNADSHVQTHPCALRDCLQCLEGSLPDKAFATWECRDSEIQVTGAFCRSRAHWCPLFA